MTTNIRNAALRNDGPDYNKFDIKPPNLKARVVLPSEEIEQHFVHSLYRSGAEMVDKGNYSKPEWDRSTYAGTFICTGDFDTVARSPRHGDPDKCPACAAMHADGPLVVERPKKTFALNVIVYPTKPNTFEVRSSAVEVALWKHGDDKKIAPIITALNEEPDKELKHLDFLIESDGSQFKKWQLQYSASPAYAKEGNEALRDAVKTAIDNELYSAEQLKAACGEAVSRDALEKEVKAAQRAAAQTGAPGEAPGTTEADSYADVAEDTTLAKTEESDLEEVSASSIDNLL